MEKQSFMENLGFDIANPRFYDRLNAVCTIILVVALLGLVFLFIRDQPRLDPSISGGVLTVQGVGTVETGAIAPEITVETKEIASNT